MKSDEFSAVGVGSSLPISDKHAREILKMIKGKDIDKAIIMLQRVTNFKQAVPFKRHTDAIAHKRGMGPGRYPIKACASIIKVLENAKNNAINKGLQESKLFIKQSTIGLGISKSSRLRSRKGGYIKSVKSTHVFVTLGEREEKKKEEKKLKKKEVKKETVKTKKEVKEVKK